MPRHLGRPFALSSSAAFAALALAASNFAQVPVPAGSQHPFFARPPEPTVHAALLSAQAQPEAAVRASNQPRGRTRVEWSLEDGAWWARGTNYKASIDTHGATYIPFLGSRAPRNFPVHMTLASASVGSQAIELAPALAAVREGERVVLDRGVIDEVYELRLDALEHTFVIEERPSGGDLRLVVALTSELARVEREAHFEFGNEHGGLHYGRASIRERDGTLTAVATRSVDAGVEIVVPWARLANAEYPLVIDPLVSTFAIDTTTFNNFDADLAHDAQSSRYLVAYTETFSATDFDVYSELLSASGQVLTGEYVQLGTDSWYLPRVANLNSGDRFMVVATTGLFSATTNRHIVGRVADPQTLTYSAALDLSGPQSDYNLYADVGGDPFATGAAYFCVAWQRELGGAGGQPQIVYNLFDGNGAPLGATPTVVDAGVVVKNVSVSEGNGGVRWNLSWDHCAVTPFDCEIWGAQVGWNGPLVTPAFTVWSSAALEFRSYSSSPRADGAHLVVFNTNAAGSSDVFGVLLAGSSVLASANLSALDVGQQSRFQSPVGVDCDGQHFAVAFGEQPDITQADLNVLVSAYGSIDNQLVSLESRTSLATTNVMDRANSIVSTAATGGADRRFLATWAGQPVPNGQQDVIGGLYDLPTSGTIAAFCSGDGSGTPCPCGNSGGPLRGCANSVNSSGALLSALGAAQISADSVTLNCNGMPATASCLFFQGTTNAGGGLGTLFGDGLRCAAGAVIRLATKTASSGSASFPAAGDPSVSVRGALPSIGAVRTYQAWYRNTAAFCTPAGFNLSNGLRVVWLP